MPKTREKYVVGGIDLYHVRNRNEQRVIQSLEERLQFEKYKNVTPEMIKDAYAYALNQLPPRYTQQGTIVLRDPVRKEDIDKIVVEALALVINNPK